MGIFSILPDGIFAHGIFPTRKKSYRIFQKLFKLHELHVTVLWKYYMYIVAFAHHLLAN